MQYTGVTLPRKAGLKLGHSLHTLHLAKLTDAYDEIWEERKPREKEGVGAIEKNLLFAEEYPSVEPTAPWRKVEEGGVT